MHKLLILLPLLGCQPARGSDQDPSDPDSALMCARAQKRFDAIPKCSYVRLPSGKPFEQYCREKRASVPPALSMAVVKCLATVATCDDEEVGACHQLR